MSTPKGTLPKNFAQFQQKAREKNLGSKHTVEHSHSCNTRKYNKAFAIIGNFTPYHELVR